MSNPTSPDPTVTGLIQYLNSDEHALVDITTNPDFVSVAVTPHGAFHNPAAGELDPRPLPVFKGWPAAGRPERFIRVR